MKFEVNINHMKSNENMMKSEENGSEHKSGKKSDEIWSEYKS